MIGHVLCAFCSLLLLVYIVKYIKTGDLAKGYWNMTNKTRMLLNTFISSIIYITIIIVITEYVKEQHEAFGIIFGTISLTLLFVVLLPINKMYTLSIISEKAMEKQ